MKREDLPEQCKTCINLKCGHVRMNGDNYYTCTRVICFLKYKQDDCKFYEEYTNEEEIINENN